MLYILNLLNGCKNKIHNMTTTKSTHSSLHLNCYYSNWLKQSSVCSSFAYQPSPTPKLWLDWQFGIVSNGYRWIWSWPLNLEGPRSHCFDVALTLILGSAPPKITVSYAFGSFVEHLTLVFAALRACLHLATLYSSLQPSNASSE